MTDRDSGFSVDNQERPASNPILDDGQVEPITPEDIQDAIDAFDEQFPDLAGLLDAELT